MAEEGSQEKKNLKKAGQKQEGQKESKKRKQKKNSNENMMAGRRKVKAFHTWFNSDYKLYQFKIINYINLFNSFLKLYKTKIICKWFYSAYKLDDRRTII